MLFSLVLGIAQVAAAAPIDLQHSGRLLDGEGQPIEGTVDLRVRLYDASDDELWSHTYTSTVVSSGYYSVTLADLDAAWFSEPVSIGVGVGLGPDLGQQPLHSVPRAAHAERAGGVVVSQTLLSGGCDVGAMAFDTTLGRLRVCTSGQWEKTIVASDGTRRWDNGELAASCDAYRHPDAGGVYEGATGSGVYRIAPDGSVAMDVWCDMVTDGGGWTLLFNLDSGDTAIHDWQDTAFWLGTTTEGSASTALTAGHKSEAFHALRDYSEVLVHAHDGTNGSTYGIAIRPLLPQYSGDSLGDILNAGNDVVFTGGATLRQGGVPTTHNTDRAQSESGDAFVDYTHPLVANQTSRWGSAQALGRIGTTLSNTISGHTLGGTLGGQHQHGLGSYGTRFESAPIGEYCATRNGYGHDAGYISFNSGSPYSSTCKSGSFAWLPVDTAVYVR